VSRRVELLKQPVEFAAYEAELDRHLGRLRR
jgi:hypothetical protein